MTQYLFDLVWVVGLLEMYWTAYTFPGIWFKDFFLKEHGFKYHSSFQDEQKQWVNYVLDGKRRYMKVETNVGKKAMAKVSKI